MNLQKAIGWNEAPLEELLDFYIGGDWGKDPEFNDDAMELAYCIRGSEIRNWNENKGNTASLRKIKKTNIAKRKLIVDDILVEISGGGPEQPVGRTILIDKTALSFEPSIPKICTNFLRLIRPKVSINSKFLDFYLKFFYNSGEVVKFQNGSNNLRNLIFPEFLKIEIPFPVPEEQHQIVEKIEELFSELDKGIENLKTAQQQLKVYRQAVLKWAFEGKLTNDNVKDGELPVGWELNPLGEYISDIESGKSYKCDERPPKESEVGIIKVSAVTWGEFDEQESKTCFSSDLYNAKYRINEGDFLFSRANTLELVGACVIVKSIHKKLMLSDKILRFIFEATIDKKYVLYFLRSKLGKRQIALLSTGNQESMRNIGQEKIKQIKFPYCIISEQKKIVQEIESRLSVCDKMEETITAGLQQAEALRQSILKRAFEGKLVKAGAKVIKLDALIKTEYEKDWQRKVLAGKLIQICYKDNNFGHTKFQKTLQICEYHAQLDFNSHYLKDVAGPFDKDFFFPFIEEGRVNEWFSEKRKQVAIFFKPGNKIEMLVKNYDDYFKTVDHKIQFVINLLKNKTTFESELISTIYTIWNNFLLNKIYISDNELIKQVYDWSESKVKFSESDIIGMKQWMTEVGLIPAGFGKLIDKPA